MSSLGGIPKKSINPSGSIKTDTVIENIEVENLTVGTDGFHPTEPDSMLATGSSDGTKTGTKRANKIDDDGDLRVKDVQAGTILTAIQTLLASGIIKVDDDASQVLLTNILSQLASGGLVIGTENGQVGGVEHVFVNNLRKMVTGAHDSTPVISWLDITSKKDRRVDKIEWTSPTFPGVTVRKQFSYTFAGGEYVPTTTGVWSIV